MDIKTALPADVFTADIEGSYKTLAKRYHPDADGTNEEFIALQALKALALAQLKDGYLVGSHGIYVTRTYLTRHGADPYFTDHPFPAEVTDKTNIPNDWQGTLRYAPSNEGVYDRIMLDLAANGIAGDHRACLAVTHADQIPVSARMMLESPAYISYGETVEDVRRI